MQPTHVLSGFAALVLVGLAAFGFQINPNRQTTATAARFESRLLKAEALDKPTHLSSEERLEAIDQCIAVFNRQGHDGIIRFGKTEDIDRMLKSFAETSCSCLVDELGQRTTTLEFVLGMAMEFAFAPRTDFSQFDGGKPGLRERALPATISLGVSTKSFDAAGLRAEAAVQDSGDVCMEAHGR